jgi:biotin carboxyl carrier protein
VRAAYTTGFAAKTALLVAKNLTTGDVGAGWLNTYVASTVAVELIPRARKGAQDLASLRLSAEPAKLTADGRSTSRVRARLTAPDGSPLAGQPVRFALASTNGRLRVLRGTTNAKGLAEAEYRAGTALGTVTITASAEEYGVTASLQLVLMSDAPARIDLSATPQRLVADGESQAALSLRVTDVHGNPNQGVPVSLSVSEGSGRLSKAAVLTDRNGEAQAAFTAGTRPGIAVIEARHTSRPPTEAELRRVYGTVFVPRWYERQERDRLTVAEWLVKPGEKVEKGRDLAVVEARRGRWTLRAPADGVFVREEKHERDEVELGDSLGYVEIDPEVWKEVYESGH